MNLREAHGGEHNQSTLDRAVLGRDRSPFREDVEARRRELREVVAGTRVLVVGGAGSIGSATTALLAELGPSALHVIDQSENYLAELVRDLRGRPGGLPVGDFRTLPLDYGSEIMGRYLRDAAPYELVLNFAALKHVRSEKDVYSLLQMLDTNVVSHVRFKRWLVENGHARRYFAVSTDKAANPTSLMGASKRLMEDVVFDVEVAPGARVTSARFANVAFSNGSLLQGFLVRLAKRQPLAVPRDTRRYFVSQREAGEICLLAALLAPHGTVAFPKLDPLAELKLLDEVATRVLALHGYAPRHFETEAEARDAVEPLARCGEWPVLLTPLDTSGEKPYEEFVGIGEEAIEIGLSSLRAIRHRPSEAIRGGLLDRLTEIVGSTDGPIDKQGLVDAIASAIPNFAHRETGKSLDDRL